jgi:hypothetical protein
MRTQSRKVGGTDLWANDDSEELSGTIVDVNAKRCGKIPFNLQVRRGRGGMPEEGIPTMARRLAESLDAEDYDAARATLAEGCRYHIGTTTLTGPDAIIASYRANGEAARGRFDMFEFSSQIEPSGASGAVITYTDRVQLQGEWHEYRCRQHVRLGKTGQIEEIRHEELPGERERLQEFERRRTSPGTPSLGC